MREALKKYINELPHNKWIYFSDRPKHIHFAELWEQVEDGKYIKRLHSFSKNLNCTAKQAVIITNYEGTAFKIIRPEVTQCLTTFRKINNAKYEKHIGKYEEKTKPTEI